MNREQRLAREVIRRFSLTPPVDVLDLATRFADLEEDSIPGDCDGLVLGLQGHRKRPLIVLDRNRHEIRKRFTLAHELGHVLLPWHLGSNVACHTGRGMFDPGTHRVVRTEAEANRFAGDLLIPSAWLIDRLKQLGTEQVAPLMDAIFDAQVSAHVACIRLVGVLPKGHVFAIVDREGTVLMSGQTTGTAVDPPKKGTRLDRRRLDRFATLAEDVTYGSRQVVWWSYRGRTIGDEFDSDPRTSADVLAALLKRHCDTEQAAVLHKRLSGVIGSANSMARFDGATSRDALRTRFRSRFAKPRPDFSEKLLEDPEFDLWLWKRANELGDR